VRVYTTGQGVDVDLHEAAYWSLESGRFGGQAFYYPKRKHFMKELQLLLTEIGLYSGPIDGEDTPATKAACEAYYYSSRPPLPRRPRNLWGSITFQLDEPVTAIM
jgi:hypothetical protein